MPPSTSTIPSRITTGIIEAGYRVYAWFCAYIVKPIVKLFDEPISLPENSFVFYNHRIVREPNGSIAIYNRANVFSHSKSYGNCATQAKELLQYMAAARDTHVKFDEVLALHVYGVVTREQLLASQANNGVLTGIDIGGALHDLVIVEFHS